MDLISECGLRPLRAVGSLYEPEAVGTIGAYAPEGMRNVDLKDRKSEGIDELKY
jgi:hypothetical protein